jgi:hypothetical protein
MEISVFASRFDYEPDSGIPGSLIVSPKQTTSVGESNFLLYSLVMLPEFENPLTAR